METCRWCGAAVSSSDANCPRCGARLRRESRACPRCKSEIRSGLAVCPHCGEDLLGRRIPWKLIAGLGGATLTVIVVYAVLSFVPLPVSLPFVATIPSPTPTEVILPPTPTATETPRPPTATPTRPPTFTPVITATATLTTTATMTPTVSASVTVTATVSPGPTQTASATPAERPGFVYAAPQLVGPGDESELPDDGQFTFTGSSIVELRWEPVGVLAADEWYSVSLIFTNRDGQPQEKVNWWKETAFVVPSDYHDDIGSDREVYWSVTVVSGSPGTGESEAVSPPSETWMFRWG